MCDLSKSYTQQDVEINFLNTNEQNISFTNQKQETNYRLEFNKPIKFEDLKRILAENNNFKTNLSGCVPIEEQITTLNDSQKEQICSQLYQISCWMVTNEVFHGNLKLQMYCIRIVMVKEKFEENLFLSQQDSQGYSERYFCTKEILDVIIRYQNNSQNLKKQLKKTMEKIKLYQQKNIEIDLWAIGVIMLEILKPNNNVNKEFIDYYGFNQQLLKKKLRQVLMDEKFTTFYQKLSNLFGYKIKQLQKDCQIKHQEILQETKRNYNVSDINSSVQKQEITIIKKENGMENRMGMKNLLQIQKFMHKIIITFLKTTHKNKPNQQLIEIIYL